MAAVSRHVFGFLAAALVFGLVVPGCSGTARTESDGVGTSGPSSSFVSVRNTSLDVTVENQAGMPLVDVVIAIKPVGRIPFTRRVTRMENGQRLSLVLSEFRGNDGTSYSLQLARPRDITVTASDVVGKKFEMTTPWQK